jgi:hypothetical protein
LNLSDSKFAYTALSRTKKKCIVVGPAEHFGKMISTLPVIPNQALKYMLSKNDVLMRQADDIRKAMDEFVAKCKKWDIEPEPAPIVVDNNYWGGDDDDFDQAALEHVQQIEDEIFGREIEIAINEISKNKNKTDS